MPRTATQLTIPDLSDFAKTLRAALAARDGLPSHASFLSLIAKSAGYGNYQYLKASAAANEAKPSRQLARALRVFDAAGVMQHWPNQTAVQGLCLWWIWAQFPARTSLREAQVNEVLKAHHAFGDHVLLRRSMIDHRLMTRTIDGSSYLRTERQPPDDAVLLIAALNASQRPS